MQESNRFTKNKHLSSNPTNSYVSPRIHHQSALFSDSVQQSGRKANIENFPRWLQQLVEPMRDTKLKIPHTNRMTSLNKNINTDKIIFPKLN